MKKACIVCGNTFSNVTPCNMWADIRSRVRCWTCKPYNTSNRRALHSFESKVCSYCNTLLPTDEFYFKASTNRRTKTSKCRTCIKKYNKQRELDIKIKLIIYKGGACINCGYKKNICALDFHHRDTTTKKFNLAHIPGINKKVLDEVDKCDLLCSNCHRELHNPDKNNLI